MTQINLLPWRAVRRTESKKKVLTLFASMLSLTLFVLITIHFVMSHRLNAFMVSESHLRQEIQSLDSSLKEIKDIRSRKNELISRMQVIKKLEINRQQVVRIFDELVHVIPKGVYLINVERKNGRVTLKGMAESNSRVSELMRNIEKSQWLAKPVLNEIKIVNRRGVNGSDFNLEFQQTRYLPLRQRLV